MKMAIAVLSTLLALSLVIIAMQPATAHNVAPRYNGQSWGVQCLAPNPRTSPPVCCDRTRSTCVAACALADESSGWKSACQANCEAAGQACHQRIQPRPPVFDRPDTVPPKTRD